MQSASTREDYPLQRNTGVQALSHRERKKERSINLSAGGAGRTDGLNSTGCNPLLPPTNPGMLTSFFSRLGFEWVRSSGMGKKYTHTNTHTPTSPTFVLPSSQRVGPAWLQSSITWKDSGYFFTPPLPRSEICKPAAMSQWERKLRRKGWRRQSYWSCLEKQNAWIPDFMEIATGSHWTWWFLQLPQ